MRRFHPRLRQDPGVRSYMGGAPSVFVGAHGWPEVCAGPLLSGDPDDPEMWVARGLAIGDIVDIRARTIRGRSRGRRVAGSLEEIALSSSPVDVEAHFEKPIHTAVTFDGTIAPVGLSGLLDRLDVLDNARVARPVDRVTGDPDLSATEASCMLYQDGVPVHRITQLLSAGLLGRRRRVVPTRWAITAVDDMLFSGLKRQLLRLPPLPELRIHHAVLHGNRIACLLVPGPWEFEMVEMWQPRSLWAHENESIDRDGERGQKSHPSSPLAGAYYSARLAVADHLCGLGAGATVLMVRRVSPDYWAPLGTWVIREAVRSALASPPFVPATLGDAAAGLDAILGTTRWRERSALLPRLRSQTTLGDFGGG